MLHVHNRPPCAEDNGNHYPHVKTFEDFFKINKSVMVYFESKHFLKTMVLKVISFDHVSLICRLVHHPH